MQFFYISKIFNYIRFANTGSSLINHSIQLNFTDMNIRSIREYRCTNVFRFRNYRLFDMTFSYNCTIILHITTVYNSTRIITVGCRNIFACIVKHYTETKFMILIHSFRNCKVKRYLVSCSRISYTTYGTCTYQFVILQYIISIPINPKTHFIAIICSG